MRTSPFGKRIIIITSGDPSGIGPEIILKCLNNPSYTGNITPLVIGDYNVFRKNARILGMKLTPLVFRKTESGFQLKKNVINFIDLGNVAPGAFRFGQVDGRFGRAAMEYLKHAVSILRNVKNAALVTAPIHKESIHKAGFRFGGHTEFLASATQSKDVTMMLVGGQLKVSLVTRHVPLRKVAEAISRHRVQRTIAHTYFALKKYFKISHPIIGVAGLNPHAGEGGTIGNEERTKILPAIRYMKKKIMNLTGPHPPDTLFYRAYNRKFDAVVCMYHDQGLIPLKMVAFEKGVNLTIGLPFIRTSPDHGTGFDIAGKGIANPSSMAEAMRLAAILSC